MVAVHPRVGMGQIRRMLSARSLLAVCTFGGQEWVFAGTRVRLNRIDVIGVVDDCFRMKAKKQEYER